MKIAIVVGELNIRGGTQKQVLRLCQYLKRNKIEFSLYTKIYDKDKTYPDFEDFDITSLYGQGYECKQENKLLRYIKKIKEGKELLYLIPIDVNIVNVHDIGFSWFMFFVKKYRKSKVVWQINDLPYCFRKGVAKFQKDTLSMKKERILQRFLTRKVDVITVNVTKNKLRVKECYNKSAEVLYCGVDYNSKLHLHKWPNRIKDFQLLSTGVFLPYRNYETLIDVVEKLTEAGVNVQLNIIGSTDMDKGYTEKINELIRRKHLEEKIFIRGQVDEETYDELYNKADAFAFVNVDQSWGLAVFEAMSCGLPTIVSNSVGAIELLHDGEDSVIVDPYDVDGICSIILKLISDEEFYNYISINANKNATSYSWDIMYSARMLDIFKKSLCD